MRLLEEPTDWKLCGHIFDEIPAWIREASPRTKELWAPDISYFHGKFHLYYAYSAFGVNTSGIALATNETLDPSSPKCAPLERRGSGSEIVEGGRLQRHRSEHRAG